MKTIFLILMIGVVGCDEGQKIVDLWPEGAPKVRQVVMSERLAGTTGSRRSLAYGYHGDARSDDDSMVVNAVPTAIGQRFRIVFDELLLPTALEQVECRDGTYSDIPEGASPNDVAKCAGIDLTRCQPCTDPATGDARPSSTCTEFLTCMAPDGTAIGIKDENGGGGASPEPDGAPDIFRLKAGVAWVECDGTRIDFNQADSFYQPSGNQLVPADVAGGIDRLGPALALQPDADLPPGADCEFKLGDTVTDKDGEAVCAPDWSDFSAYLDSACATCMSEIGSGSDDECSAQEIRQCLKTADPDCAAPGDISLLSFSTEPFVLQGSSPLDGQMGVLVTVPILLDFNVAVDEASIANVTIDEGGSSRAFTATVSMTDPTIVTLEPDGSGDLLPSTAYTITVPVTVTTAAGFPLSMSYSISFMTGA